MNLKHITVDGDSVTLSLKELEEWRSHYRKISQEQFDIAKSSTDSEFVNITKAKAMFYAGKSDVIIEILKCADDLICE